MGWVFGDEDGYRKFGGKTYERYKTSRSKSKLKDKGKDLTKGMWSSYSSYRVVRSGAKYELYVR